jgi:hypothetical protein
MDKRSSLFVRSVSNEEVRFDNVDGSTVVRDFVEEKIIEPKRRNRLDSFSNDSKDFLDNLMNYIDSQKTSKASIGDDVDMDRQSALYALVNKIGISLYTQSIP